MFMGNTNNDKVKGSILHMQTKEIDDKSVFGWFFSDISEQI